MLLEPGWMMHEMEELLFEDARFGRRSKTKGFSAESTFCGTEHQEE
jgi:hypothetical protein